MKKINKNKVYELIGRAVTYLVGYVIVESAFIASALYVVNNCITTIR